jgi:ATP-binding cassette subfamily B protein
VWSFCGIGREHSRLDATIDREMAARRRSLLYLEKLRLDLTNACASIPAEILALGPSCVSSMPQLKRE